MVHGDDDQPGLEWVDVKPAEFLPGQNGQNHSREQQKFGERENLVGRNTGGKPLEDSLKFQQ
jgi:hypothetical protein